MTSFNESASEILTTYEKLRNKYKIELDEGPDGSLLHQMKGKHVQFLHSFNQNGVRKRKGINRKPDLIKNLAKKEFDRKAHEILSNNVAVINEAMNKHIPFDVDQILQSMNKAYALLPAEYFFDRDMLSAAAGMDDGLQAKVRRHEEWWKMPYKEYWGYPQHKTRTTSRGQKVRSISELLIAEKLYEYNIPFHYEEELEIGGKTFAPDFTFEGADYKCFYLDYFGMMDNEGYARRNLLKLGDYYNAGLIPGDNLIVAFNLSGILNAGTIKAIIETEIIPRL